MGEEEKPCDFDDLLCQTSALDHLKGLEAALGGERYREEFPEMQGIAGKIALREAKLKSDLERCSKPVEEERPGQMDTDPESDIEEE